MPATEKLVSITTEQLGTKIGPARASDRARDDAVEIFRSARSRRQRRGEQVSLGGGCYIILQRIMKVASASAIEAAAVAYVNRSSLMVCAPVQTKEFLQCVGSRRLPPVARMIKAASDTMALHGPNARHASEFTHTKGNPKHFRNSGNFSTRRICPGRMASRSIDASGPRISLLPIRARQPVDIACD